MVIVVGVLGPRSAQLRRVRLSKGAVNSIVAGQESVSSLRKCLGEELSCRRPLRVAVGRAKGPPAGVLVVTVLETASASHLT